MHEADYQGSGSGSDGGRISDLNPLPSGTDTNVLQFQIEREIRQNTA